MDVMESNLDQYDLIADDYNALIGVGRNFINCWAQMLAPQAAPSGELAPYQPLVLVIADHVRQRGEVEEHLLGR